MKKSIAYLAFYSTSNPDLLQRAIMLADGSKFCHVEIAVPDNDKFLCYSASHIDGGVRLKRIDLNNGKWTLIPVEIDLDRLKKIFLENNNKKYDYFGLLSTKIYCLPSFPNRWFCSELCSEILGLKNPCNYGVKRLYQTVIEKNPQLNIQ
ncbi:MAG: hypothetical protein [Bacteriophage sp.]|nr:MAG: hypothetical protein [Bacteriophage sp.]